MFRAICKQMQRWQAAKLWEDPTLALEFGWISSEIIKNNKIEKMLTTNYFVLVFV